jgi:3-deoxy-D-manno-octulosonic-acid transferase
MKERLGWLGAHIPATKPGGIWLHAVSVGEVMSAIALLRKLRATLPETPIFVSTTTLAGHELAESRLKGLADGVFFAPVDFPFAVRRVLRRISPALVINFETEIWPHRIREAKRSGAMWAQVNGRISDKAWPTYERLGWLFAAVMPQMDLVAAQSEEDARRFSALGYPGEVLLAGNLKYDFDPSARPVAPELLGWLKASDKPLWVAASTTAGSVDDDDAVLDAYEALGGEVRLLVAPRKPERFEPVAAKMAQRGMRFARRTALREADVLLLDSIGELAALFAHASVVFVGGSFNETQGHNILEPAFFGKPVLTGPNMRNFAEIQAAFVKARAVRVVERPDELAAAVRAALLEPELGERGQRVAQSMRGAADRLVRRLTALLGQGVPKGLLPLATCLAPLSWPWRLIAARPVAARKLPVPVISVGNLSMGGTGKTPLVIAIGKELVGAGKRVGILTRGYKRDSSEIVTLLAGETAAAAITGDEAQLFVAEGIFAVGIGADRHEVGKRLLERGKLDVLLLDDGFQHRRLARDLDVVCVDALRPFPGWGVPPAGWLREPLAALRRADVFVLTRVARGVEPVGLRALLGDKPVYVAQVEETLPELPPAGRRVAFAGIGNPAAFRQTLDRLGLSEVPLVIFADHHNYQEDDWRRLRTIGEVWITTAKDAVKVPAGMPVYVVRQQFKIDHSFNLHLISTS